MTIMIRLLAIALACAIPSIVWLEDRARPLVVAIEETMKRYGHPRDLKRKTAAWA